MQRKPYDIHSVADVFYLKICRKLFAIIDDLSIEHENNIELGEENCRDLAYVITAYFEDVVNEIGFWQSVVDLNKKYFKKRLPFFDAPELEEEEQSSDDIVSADIHYLLYINYAAMVNGDEEKEFVFFESAFFRKATESIYNYLADIEEVHTTPFYEKYLVPDEDFIDFKNKLMWFALEGYITGVEFILRMEDFSLELHEQDTDKDMFPAVMYAETDRLIFEQPSVITAYTALEIFTGALRCTEAKKEEIRSLKLRPYGIFHIQNESAAHITFLHTATGEEFKVLKSSFANPPVSDENEYWLTTLAKWDNDHYVSGLCFASPYKGEEIYNFNLQTQQSIQKHFPPYREQIIKTATDFRNKASSYFGKELVEFSSGKELQNNLVSFNEWYFKNVTDSSKLTNNKKPGKMPAVKELMDAGEVALFIPPADGFEIIYVHKILLETLQMCAPEKASWREIKNVTDAMLTNGISKEYWLYIKKQFDLPNLSLFLQCDVEDDRDFEALLRIYKPNDFSASKLPRFKTFTSEKVSTEKAKEIFGIGK